MKRIVCLALSLVFLLFLVGCDNSAEEKNGISVVVTAFPHYDFVRQLTAGSENVQIKMLISPGNEVHTYEPTPSDVLAVRSCDLFVYTGGESDVWAEKFLDSPENNDIHIVSFMDICAPDGYAEKHDHESDHDHEDEYDEHVWTLPVMAEAVCVEISRMLCEIDEENSDIYNKNLENYLLKLSELDADFQSIAAEAKRDSIVVADRFPFYHMATHYKIKYHTAFPGCSSSTEPSAATVAALNKLVREEDIPYVFTIEFSNGRIAKSVTEGTEAEILPLHSCHNVSASDFESGVTYYELMKQNAENLRKALCE